MARQHQRKQGNHQRRQPQCDQAETALPVIRFRNSGKGPTETKPAARSDDSGSVLGACANVIHTAGRPPDWRRRVRHTMGNVGSVLALRRVGLATSAVQTLPADGPPVNRPAAAYLPAVPVKV
ncbi:MAG: hypothetical protein R2856_12040 [Caldilineaceae bacterium]